MDEEVKESLLCRFVINLTAEEKTPDRLFFHLQNAYWYFLDFLKPTEQLSQIDFYHTLLSSLPEFDEIRANLKFHLKKHKQYAKTIPLYGAILLNESLDSVLLVMNYHQTVYSFPKGKMNKNEAGIDCAKREVWEEVGLDISKMISAKDYLEFVCEDTGQPQRMYIISGVNENHKFATSTRYEIGAIHWVKLSEIKRRDSRFVYLMPFIQGLNKYIATKSSQSSKAGPPQPPKDKDFKSVVSARVNRMIREFKEQLGSAEPRSENVAQFETFRSQKQLLLQV